MLPRYRFLLILFLFYVPSCNTPFSGEGSTPKVDAATIKVNFRNDSAEKKSWSIEDVNSDTMVFRDEVFQPKEVKSATVSTGPSRRFGEVRYKDSEFGQWKSDSLIENDVTVNLRSSEDGLGQSSPR